MRYLGRQLWVGFVLATSVCYAAGVDASPTPPPIVCGDVVDLAMAMSPDGAPAEPAFTRSDGEKSSAALSVKQRSPMAAGDLLTVCMASAPYLSDASLSTRPDLPSFSLATQHVRLQV